MINKIQFKMLSVFMLFLMAASSHAVTKKLMFTSYDFEPINSGVHQIWNSTYGMRVDWASPGHGILAAKVDFPLGAEFESITCNVYDNNPNANQNVRVNLLRVEAVNGGTNPGLSSSVIFDMTSNDNSNFQQISDSSVGSSAPTHVSNWSCTNGVCNYYSYYIYVELEGLGKSIRSCMIKYKI